MWAGCDQRPHLRLRLHAVPDDDLVARLRESGQKLVGHLFFQQQSRTCAADFALTRVDSKHGKLKRNVRVRVGKDDVWAFSTKLKSDFLDVRGGGLHDLAAGGGAAGEGDFVHEHALGEGLANRGAGSEHELSAAWRKIGFFNQLEQPDGR